MGGFPGCLSITLPLLKTATQGPLPLGEPPSVVPGPFFCPFAKKAQTVPLFASPAARRKAEGKAPPESPIFGAFRRSSRPSSRPGPG